MFRNLKPVLDTLSTVLLIVAASALLWRLYRLPSPPSGSRSPVETVQNLSIPSSETVHVRGTGDVVLVEFSDYECPFCGRHALTTAPVINKELVESGKIRYMFFNFPLPIHPRAQKAAEAAECAAQQGKFWEMSERLFENQQALEIVDLTRRAEDLGLDRSKFLSCVESGNAADKVHADMAEGRRLGVSSTPAFFVGTVQPDGTIRLAKRINGAVPFEQFETVVNEMLPKQRAQR